MGLNIKNERVHELARQAATVTGKSQTGAIEEALERLLAAYGEDPVTARRTRVLDAARRIADAYQADPGDPSREIHSVEDLYDDTVGPPR